LKSIKILWSRQMPATEELDFIAVKRCERFVDAVRAF
jgi:hypothetical protein